VFPSRSGTIVECDPIGLLEQGEDGEVDHKVVAMRIGERVALNDAVVASLKHFITGVFAHVPGKRTETGRLLSRAEAEAYVHACRDDS
jgi:inorganic pyrophosphatase